jgi:hypothetical protein
MGQIEVVILNDSSCNYQIDGNLFGPGKHVLTYYQVVKYRHNHDYLVLKVRDLEGVRTVYVPCYLIRRITWIRRGYKCY